MKKAIFLILGLSLVAASCNKPAAIIEDKPVGGIEAPVTDPVEPETETPTKSNPPAKTAAPSITLADLIIPKTDEQQDFEIDQNTIKNVEQDAKLEEHEKEITDLQNTVNNPPAPLPPPPAPSPTPEPAPQPTPPPPAPEPEPEPEPVDTTAPIIYAVDIWNDYRFRIYANETLDTSNIRLSKNGSNLNLVLTVSKESLLRDDYYEYNGVSNLNINDICIFVDQFCNANFVLTIPDKAGNKATLKRDSYMVGDPIFFTK